MLNKAKIGRGSVVAAGAVVKEGFVCPPFSLVVGCPAAVKKSYGETDAAQAEQLEKARRHATKYAMRWPSARLSFCCTPLSI